jgi:sugar phosphate permease
VYFAFAAGYLLSYLLRTVNAVISPELTRELALSSGALGLLTSAYFIAFAAMQIPAGMLLDRYGPRRVEPALLLFCGIGTLAFALADGVTGLLIARALIGLGVAVNLMAPLKAISAWYPPERQASLASWIMAAGGVGALAATTPVELALRVTTWRGVFVVLCVFAFGIAAWIWWRVPDTQPATAGGGVAAQWAGVRAIFRNRRFWWIAPLGSFGMGSFMAIQGLWSVPWLMEVNGYDRATAAGHLLLMSAVILAGYVILGMLATRLARQGLHPRHLFAGGFALNAVALAAIVLQWPGTYTWWALYGFGAAVNILGYPILGEGFPKELAGRASTALNLLMFVGSFAAQWGIGLIIDATRGLGQTGSEAGLRTAFAVVLTCHVLTYVWFLAGWRRHAVTRVARAA